MTPARYRKCLERLGKPMPAFASMRAFARHLNIDNTSARRYGFGGKAIPPELAKWLEMLMAAPDPLAVFELHPYPEGWAATADRAA